MNNDERALMQELVGHEYGYADMFNIPFIMHAPGVTFPSVIERTGGQADILPTVANLVGASLDGQIHFGQDLLNSKSNVLPMRHFLPTGSIVADTGVFIPGNDFEDGTNYSFDGEELPEGGGAAREEYDRALELADSIRQLREATSRIGTVNEVQGFPLSALADKGSLFSVHENVRIDGLCKQIFKADRHGQAVRRQQGKSLAAVPSIAPEQAAERLPIFGQPGSFHFEDEMANLLPDQLLHSR